MLLCAVSGNDQRNVFFRMSSEKIHLQVLKFVIEIPPDLFHRHNFNGTTRVTICIFWREPTYIIYLLLTISILICNVHAF